LSSADSFLDVVLFEGLVTRVALGRLFLVAKRCWCISRKEVRTALSKLYVAWDDETGMQLQCVSEKTTRARQYFVLQESRLHNTLARRPQRKLRQTWMETCITADSR